MFSIALSGIHHSRRRLTAWTFSLPCFSLRLVALTTSRLLPSGISSFFMGWVSFGW